MTASAGLVAAPLPYAVAPYATSYTAHVAHHSIATPVAVGYAAAPQVAAARYLAAPAASYVAVPSPYIAGK